MKNKKTKIKMPYNPKLNEATNKTHDLKYQIEILNKIVSLEKYEPITLSEAEKLSLYDLLIRLKSDLRTSERYETRLKYKDERQKERGVKY